MRITARTRPAALALAALLLVSTGCGDDDDVEAGSSFCEEVRARSDAFSADGAKEVPATLIGALRAVIDGSGAPQELRDAYETITEAGTDEELDDALADIDRIVAQCGVDLEG